MAQALIGLQPFFALKCQPACGLGCRGAQKARQFLTACAEQIVRSAVSENPIFGVQGTRPLACWPMLPMKPYVPFLILYNL
jgi:hypothetical protein